MKTCHASVQDLLTTLKSREEDQTYQCQPKRKSVGDKFLNKETKWGRSDKAKPIVAKPKAETSYLIDVVWYS